MTRAMIYTTAAVDMIARPGKDAKMKQNRSISVLLTAVGAMCWSSIAMAQNAERTLPPVLESPDILPTIPAATQPAAAAKEDQAVLDSLRGIVLIESADRAVADRSAGQAIVNEVQILKPRLSETGPGNLNDRLREFLGKPLSMRTIDQIVAAVIQDLSAAGRPVVDVSVPEQDVTDGFLRLLVRDGKVGDVRVEGAKHFLPALLQKQVRIRAGDSIQRDPLISDIEWLNRNPFRNVGVVFERGQAPGTTDIILRVNDAVPFRIFGGYDNTGSESTGEDRIQAGFNWGNAFGLDHQLNYQLTSGTNIDTFQAHGGSYLIPLPNRDTLSIFGTWSKSRPATNDRNLDLEGSSWQLSARYLTPLQKRERFTPTLSFGFDFKSSDNNLEFGGDQVFDRGTQVVQFSAAYNFDWTYLHNGKPLGKLNGDFSLVASPGGLSGNNDDAAFDESRESADATYAYVRASLSNDIPVETIEKYPAVYRQQMSMQISTGALLGSEQLGFGGYDSIRGYEERAGNGDHGVVFTQQFEQPLPGPFTMLSADQFRWKDTITLLAFLDAGYAINEHGDDSNPANNSFLSTGVGLRYQVAPYVNIRYDYGWQLNDEINDGKSGQQHLGISVNIPF